MKPSALPALHKNSFSKNSFRPALRPAETLVEVIMALFILALGSATATTLIVNSLQSNSFSRDNLIALNLAVEGIEAVRNIRDTNWLKFSYDRGNCWNLKPLQEAGTEDCNDRGDLIEAGNYTVNLNPARYEWSLSDPIIGGLDLNNALAPNDSYLLGFVDVTPSTDTDGNGVTTDDQDLYISAPFIDDPDGPLLPSTGDSRFYRMVTIDYSGVNPEEAENVNVTSLVQWKVSGIMHRVTLSTSLPNYLQVSAS